MSRLPTSAPPPPPPPPPSPPVASTEQHLLVLTGLIGSGKSTFAHTLSHLDPYWIRCNQDDLGSRAAVHHRARTALLSGQHALIDRTNIDRAQRRTWLELGRDVAPLLPPSAGLRITALVFSTPREECADRLRRRVDHPTIRTPQQAVEVLARFGDAYEMPRTVEGFHACVEVRPEELSNPPTREEVERILDRIRRAERADGVLPPPPVGAGLGSRGRGRGGGRTRGTGRGGRGRSAVFAPHGMAQDGTGLGGATWASGNGGAASLHPRPWQQQQQGGTVSDAEMGLPPWRRAQQARWIATPPRDYAAENSSKGQGGSSVVALPAASPLSAPLPPPPPPPPPSLPPMLQ